MSGLDLSVSILCKQILQQEVQNRLVSWTRNESWEIERAQNKVDSTKYM